MADQLSGEHRWVKIYNGYGHKDDLVVYGHVFKHKPVKPRTYTGSVVANVFHLLRLFFISPVAGAKVQLRWGSQVMETVTEKDGFFKFEWQSNHGVSAGWHAVEIYTLNADNTIATRGAGKLFVPHITQFAFISDIDDTVLISHSATVFRRLKVLFTKNPRTRETFTDVVTHYALLSRAHTDGEIQNPFFYVSSSEWNLYDDLHEFFQYNHLPEGSFLLSQAKKWFELLKTGKTKHEGKLLRVARILNAFPKQKFVLLGDNSQSDPAIYASIVKKYPDRIHAVYIRNIQPAHEPAVREIFRDLEQYNVHTFLFTNSSEAIRHSAEIGLIPLPV